jgi:DNA-binding HxlR family transcriptional regulator
MHDIQRRRRRNQSEIDQLALEFQKSAAVLAAIEQGVTRPGQLERFIPGISTKVLSERLRKLLAYQLIGRQEYPGRVLRVEYQLTDRGEKLAAILKQLRDLDATHAVRKPARRANTSTQAG